MPSQNLSLKRYKQIADLSFLYVPDQIQYCFSHQQDSRDISRLVILEKKDRLQEPRKDKQATILHRVLHETAEQRQGIRLHAKANQNKDKDTRKFEQS
ncbi:unnamed protein product [Paramecium pentaurelia]|uniref:Uncharacterized protein n=1 Tax=Paramecium pentaurelia TaxID=43138 RepID=A0A8S1W454_9CILI|nr:unnamed protein product [Paramecium pentaurelia]